MKESSEKISFSKEEHKLLKKYIDEYNDIYEKIFILSQDELINNLRKRVELSLKERINFFQKFSINKIEEYFIEKYYIPDLKLALIAKKHILKQYNKDKKKNYFDGEIIQHCDKDKKKNYYLHSCGEKLYYFKYKISVKNTENEISDNFFFRKINDYILYCIKCDNIYKSSMIKLKCFHTGKIFYSKLINNNDCTKEICYATWKKYHCNVIINDTMKCQKCKNSFIYNKEKNILICRNCKLQLNASKIRFKCLLCKKEFISEVKIYNPFEYKILKISIKDALIKKDLAFPKYMACKCDININNTQFFHKSSCNGILYFGNINEQKIVICAKCDSISIYEEFIWTCPKCLKRFKINKNYNNDNGQSNDKSNNINYYLSNNFEDAKLSLKNSKIIKLNQNELKSQKYSNIRRDRHFFSNFDIDNIRNSSLIRNTDIKLKTKIKSINKDYFDDINNMHYSRIRVKKKLINQIESSQEKSRSINNTSKIKSNLEKNLKKNLKIYLPNSQSFSKENKIILLKQKNKYMLRRPTNYSTNLSSRNNSIKKLIKTSRENDRIKSSDKFNASLSLNHRIDLNKILYNSKKIINNKNINRGSFISDYNNKINSITASSEKHFSGNKITKYIKIKKNIKKQSINNIKHIYKAKEYDEIKKPKYDISNENENKFTNCTKPRVNYLRNVNNLKNIINYCIVSPKEFTNINITKNYIDKKKFFSNNNSNLKDNRFNYSINENEADGKKQKNKLNHEKNIMNKLSNSTAYESDQNSKLNSLKLGQFYYNINNPINNPEYNNISEYKIIKQIGRGSFGQIFMVESEKKQFYALKKIIACSIQEINMLEHEYQILYELNSSEEKIDLVNIYKIETKQLDPTTFVMYVLMELSNTDWEKEILNRKKTQNFYTEKQLISIMSSLIKTFSSLQKKKISHRDIKPQNILVFNDKNYKLADFGEAKELIGNSKVTEKRTLRGTELYMSPILFNALRSRKPIKYIKHNTFKSDVFSFGLCILFAGSLCFESIYDIRELKKNEDINKVIKNYLGKRYSKEFINFINNMIDVNEDTRSDFIELEQKFNSMIM